MVSGSDNDSRVGGMIGSIQNSEFKIQNCYNTGAINGKTQVGGLAGAMYNAQCTMYNCYNAGYVSGDTVTDPFVNLIQNSSFNIHHCYFDKQLCPLKDKHLQDAEGPTAHSTAEMIGDSLKTELGDTYWSYNENEYPRLKTIQNSELPLVHYGRENRIFFTFN